MAVHYIAPIPTPGVTPGPTWATEINEFFSEVVDHNHTGSDESPIVTASININADLPFNSFGTNTLLYNLFINGSSLPTIGQRVDGIYVVNDALYFENAAGAQIQLTNSTGIVPNGTGAANGFLGDYANVPAGVWYTASSQTYYFRTTNTAPPGTDDNSYGAIYANRFIVDAAGVNNLGLTFETESGTDGGTLTYTPGTTQYGSAGEWLANSSGSALYNGIITGGTSASTDSHPVMTWKLNSTSNFTSDAHGAILMNPVTSVVTAANNGGHMIAHSAFSGSGSWTSGTTPANSSSFKAIQFQMETGASGSGSFQQVGYITPYLTATGGMMFNAVGGIIDLNGSSGAGGGFGIGLGGYSTTNHSITVYGQVGPSTDQMYALGSPSLMWDNVYTYAVVGNATDGLILNDGSTSTTLLYKSGALQPGAGTPTIGSFSSPIARVYADILFPMASYIGPTSLSAQNVPIMWGFLPIAPNTGGTVIPTGGVNISSVLATALGAQLTVFLTSPISNTNNAAIMVTCQDTGVPNGTSGRPIFTAFWQNASSFVINIIDSQNLVANPRCALAFVVVGAP